MQDMQNSEVVAVGQVNQGLYLLNTSITSAKNKENSIVCSASHVSSNNDNLWHSRLGHASYSKLDYIHILKINKDVDHSCTICPLSKQQRLPFPISTLSTNTIFLAYSHGSMEAI